MLGDDLQSGRGFDPLSGNLTCSENQSVRLVFTEPAGQISRLGIRSCKIRLAFFGKEPYGLGGDRISGNYHSKRALTIFHL